MLELLLFVLIVSENNVCMHEKSVHNIFKDIEFEMVARNTNIIFILFYVLNVPTRKYESFRKEVSVKFNIS